MNRRPVHPIRFCTAALLALVLAAVARAEVRMEIEAGYDGRFRAGRWSPVFVDVWQDSIHPPRTAILKLRVPNASSSVMEITQALGVQAEKQKYIVYAPVAMEYEPLTASLIDAETGKLLAQWPPRDSEGQDRGGEQVGFLVVASGSAPVLQNFRRTSGSGATIVSNQRQRHLPQAAVGYDSVDVLVLNKPDWSDLSDVQQNAMLSWVRAGGTIYLLPGAERVPDASPLAGAMPARLGEPILIKLSPDERRGLGLPDRFAEIAGRSLLLSPGAEEVAVFDSLPSAAVRRIGLGQIVIIPFDLASMQFQNEYELQTLWTQLFDKTMGAAPDQGASDYYSYYEADIRAAHAALDTIGDIEGVGSFGFSYIAILIGGLMLIVGPVDWLVLKKLGRQPWTWATTAGWIGLVTVGAIYAGHLLKSGDLHFRTLRLIDQAGGRVVAHDDVALVYAPRSAYYKISSDPNTWWQPVPSGDRWRGDTFSLPLATHQDYRGSIPEQMWINVWNWRFLRGTSLVDLPPIVETSLQRDANTLRGRIVNRGDKTLRDIVIDTADFRFPLSLTLQPGESASFGPHTGQALQRETSGNASFRGIEAGGFESVGYGGLFALNAARNDGVKRRLGNERAVVFATVENPDTDVVLDDADALTQHRAMLRAVVPVEYAPSADQEKQR